MQQHGRVADAAGGDLDAADVKSCRADGEVDLAPDVLPGPAKLADAPFLARQASAWIPRVGALAADFDASIVYEQV